MARRESRWAQATGQLRRALFLLPLLAAGPALLACTNDVGLAGQSKRDGDLANEPSGDAGVTVLELDARAADAFVAPSRHDADAGEMADAGRVSLVLHELWTRLEPVDDPFDDRPQVVDCTWGATMAETLSDERAFGVDTGFCNYLTVTQPTLWRVAAGSSLKVRLWHFELSAPEPAEAHTAVLVDGLTVMDEQVAIPGPGALLVRVLRAPRDIPAGAPVHFHLHNHGANSWALVELSSTP
ncbi:MAG: hypothetical protein JWN04_2098 [Myxococcaceae bacterium]|nr:hypothetical protein [Myxococcaceae bacterium]